MAGIIVMLTMILTRHVHDHGGETIAMRKP
jgi:hypothetical protein